jgi:hypothetical protein
VSVVPPWLQILGVAGGIVGTLLGIINLLLRIRENKPRLSVASELEPTRENDELRYRFIVTIRNRSHVPVLVDHLYFEAPHPTQGMSEVRVPETYGGRNIPFWLEPRDRERFEVMTEFMRERMKKRGFEGVPRVTATVIDGGGNRYRSKPIAVVDMSYSRPLPQDPP